MLNKISQFFLEMKYNLLENEEAYLKYYNSDTETLEYTFHLNGGWYIMTDSSTWFSSLLDKDMKRLIYIHILNGHIIKLDIKNLYIEPLKRENVIRIGEDTIYHKDGKFFSSKEDQEISIEKLYWLIMKNN